VTRDGTGSLLINEEDHLRIQVIEPGFLVESCCVKAQEMERAVGQSVRFAHHPRIGYLTSALTNAGTGLRVSVLLHLPGLTRIGQLSAHFDAARELGATVRGLYGEGTLGAAGFYQISNRRSFGVDSRDLAWGVAAFAQRLIEAERESRRMLFQSDAGRVALAEEVYEVLTELKDSDPTPRELLHFVSILRLAASEGLLRVNMASTAEWVAIAGVAAALESEMERGAERFEAGRRSAVLRQRLRRLLEPAGTFTGEKGG
jgi:protein arginine kinase